MTMFDDPFGDSYVRVKTRRETAESIAARLAAEGEELQPVKAHGKAIASSFWGRAWCRAIEEWQDYESRLPAGRSLLKNGGVIDLKLSGNRAQAQVVADRLYQVQIRFSGVEEEQLNALRNACAGKLTSLIDLIRGDLSDEVMELICDPAFGLFPRYSELKPGCDCLDDAVLCRHAAAALYAIAPRLDDQPELFFTLRGIDPKSFFALDALAGQEMENALSPEDLTATFGIEIDL